MCHAIFYQMTTTTMQIMCGMPQQQAPPATQKKRANGKMYNNLRIVTIIGYNGAVQTNQFQCIWALFQLTKDVNTHGDNMFTTMEA